MKYTKNTTGKDKKNIVVTEGGSIWTNAEKAGFFNNTLQTVIDVSMSESTF